MGFALVHGGHRAAGRRRGTGFDEGLRRVVGLGGDTDTNAAVAGALLGAAHGVGAIPPAWLGARRSRGERKPRRRRWRPSREHCATLCYMPPERLDRVGVRELRQNLSVYLRRVKEGEALEVTEHGRTVARLVPARQTESVLERLIAEGKATRGRGRLDDLPPLTGPITNEASKALRRQRQDKI